MICVLSLSCEGAWFRMEAHEVTQPEGGGVNGLHRNLHRNFPRRLPALEPGLRRGTLLTRTGRVGRVAILPTQVLVWMALVRAPHSAHRGQVAGPSGAQCSDTRPRRPGCSPMSKRATDMAVAEAPSAAMAMRVLKRRTNASSTKTTPATGALNAVARLAPAPVASKTRQSSQCPLRRNPGLPEARNRCRKSARGSARPLRLKTSLAGLPLRPPRRRK
jgi:hypothetical protein